MRSNEVYQKNLTLMKREIKFRYWDKRDGWCGAFSVHQSGIVRFGDTEPIWQTPEEAGGVLMQFTGLRDKSGKEIYEGDVVKFGWQNGYKTEAVEWRDGGFWIGPKKSGWTIFDKKCEVVGNIYENPELLAKEE